jgi:tetratricopeptide (TPR) repeat protein
MTTKRKQGKRSVPAATARPAVKPKVEKQAVAPARPTSPWVWIAALLALTAVVFGPMLSNGLTNWDDQFYVIDNLLLRGPDWKGIFTQPVVSNYHPLTILTLALNYQLSELRPFSYLLVNLLFHLANVALVFYFIWRIADRRAWVAGFVALIFAVHPMHVESVAWVSERKDVLYTFFYLLALLRYWTFLETGKRRDWWLTFGFFALSLLSKPAAVVLPLVLLLLDYWRGRAWTRNVLLEKLPFFAVSLAFGIGTVMIQTKAIASMEAYSLLDRFFFACYSLVTYFTRFFVPYPLSAFHPYPAIGELGTAIRLAPLGLLVLAGAVWLLRRNRAVVFGMLFFVVNLLLVLQFVAIGNTLISERYTYVPYIGLAFALAMLLAERPALATLRWGALAAAALVFGWMARERTGVWKNSETLWSDAIAHYPGAEVPRTNRGHYYSDLALQPKNASRAAEYFEKAAIDCEIALKADSTNLSALDLHGIIMLHLNRLDEAIADANRMIALEPNLKKAYTIRGAANIRLGRYDATLADCDQALRLDPNDADALNNRGTALFNGQKRYADALADFDRSLQLRSDGNTHLNRSRCHYMLGNRAKALEDAQTAARMGIVVPADYMAMLQQ